MEDKKSGLEGKKIYVVLKSGRVYSGVMQSIDDNDMITITDKFDKLVMFAKSEISSLEVEE